MDKLKIYSAYLPYGLKVKDKDGFIGTVVQLCAENIDFDANIKVFNNFDFRWLFFDRVKPILFSLEDLTKEITINGETFVPFDELIKIKNVRLRVEKYENGDKKLLNINTFSFSLFDFEYKIIEKLLEWKFNVFNLPEIEYIKVTEENNPYK